MISDSSEIIKLRRPKLCGLIGVIIKLFVSGVKMGPPHDREYPVEPVGVEIITPSDQ